MADDDMLTVKEAHLRVTPPKNWRANLTLAADALVDIGKALHRIADALEDRGTVVSQPEQGAGHNKKEQGCL